jgi:hypothetical protein
MEKKRNVGKEALMSDFQNSGDSSGDVPIKRKRGRPRKTDVKIPIEQPKEEQQELHEEQPVVDPLKEEKPSENFSKNQPIWWKPDIDHRPSWWVIRARDQQAGTIISINQDTQTALCSFYPYATPYIDAKLLVPLSELKHRIIPHRGG